MSYERGVRRVECSAVHDEMTYCFTTSDKHEGFCHNAARCHFYTDTLLILLMLYS